MMVRRFGRMVLLGLALVPQLVAASDGVLYVRPERAHFHVGERFDMQIFVDTDGTAISAAEAQLTFDPHDLAVESISTDGSILSSWPTEPSFSNTDGEIKFSGWASNPYTGGSGLLVTVHFRALRSTSGNARLAAGAALAAGGVEENIITSMRSAAFTISPHEVLPKPPETQPVVQLQDATTSTESMSEPVFKAPSFVEYETDINAGERIIAKGVAQPGARVAVWLAHSGASPARTDLLAAQDGSFTFVSDGRAQDGMYQLWAAETAEEQTGPESRRLVITVHGRTISVATASRALLSSLPYLALALIFGGGFVTFVVRRRTH